MGQCSYSTSVNRNLYLDRESEMTELSLTRSERERMRKSSSVMSYENCYRRNAEASLKASLTHPTIQRHIRIFISSQRQMDEAILDCYLNAQNIRRLFFLNDHDEAAERLQQFTNTYMHPLSNHHLLCSLHEKYKPLISISLGLHYSCEGLRLLQYELFFLIQETIWIPFCGTALYKEMLRKKEVRMCIKLFTDEEESKLDDRFDSIVPEAA